MNLQHELEIQLREAIKRELEQINSSPVDDIFRLERIERVTKLIVALKDADYEWRKVIH